MLATNDHCRSEVIKLTNKNNKKKKKKKKKKYPTQNSPSYTAILGNLDFLVAACATMDAW